MVIWLKGKIIWHWLTSDLDSSSCGRGLSLYEKRQGHYSTPEILNKQKCVSISVVKDTRSKLTWGLMGCRQVGYKNQEWEAKS